MSAYERVKADRDDIARKLKECEPMTDRERSNVARARGLALALTNVSKLSKPRLQGVEEIGQEIADLLAPLLPDISEPGCDES